MRYILFFLLLSISILGQTVLITKAPELQVSDVDLGTFVQSATPDTNTIEVSINVRRATVNSLSSSDTNLYFPSNLELLADSNRGLVSNTIGDWVPEGEEDSLFVSNGDGTFRWNNIPTELNPNSNFDNWGYVEIVTDGDMTDSTSWQTITSPWHVNFGGSGVASIDGSQASAKSLRQNSIFESGKTYKVTFDLLTASSGILNVWVNGVQLIVSGLSSAGSYEYIIAATATGTLYFEALSGFVGTLDNVSVSELITPTGWTASTFDANNYVIEDPNGIKWVNDGTTSLSITLSNCMEIGKQYIIKAVIYSKTGTGYIYNYAGQGVPSDIYYTSVNTFIDTVIADGTNILLSRRSGVGSFELVLSEFSVKEYHPTNNISLGINGLTTNQYYDYLFGWQEGEENISPYTSFEDSVIGFSQTRGVGSISELHVTDGNVSFKFAKNNSEVNAYFYFSGSYTENKYYRVMADIYNDGVNQIDYRSAFDGSLGTDTSFFGNGAHELNILKQASSSNASGIFFMIYVNDVAYENCSVYVDNIRIYELDSESQKIEQGIPTITINGTDYTLPATNYTRQDTGLSFVARGNNSDTITVSFSDTCKTKIDNSLKIDYDKVLITKDSTKNVPFIVDVSTVGNFSETITTDNTATNSDESVTVTWSVQAAEGSISAPTSLAITDSADGLYLDWDNNTESISGYKIYRSTDNFTYSLLTTVVNSYYNDTDIIEALRYYYYVTAYKSTESASSDTVNSKSLVTLANYDAVIYIDSTAGATRNGTYAQPYKYLSEVVWEDLDEGTYGSDTKIKIFIKGGYHYVGGIEMLDVDASANSPIIIDVYGSTERYILRPTVLTSTDYLIKFAQDNTDAGTGSTYITLKNAEIVSRKWINLQNGSYFTFDNCFFHHLSNTNPDYTAPDGGLPFNHKWSSTAPNIYLTVKNCIFEGAFYSYGAYSDMIGLRKSKYALFENNIFKNIPHVLLSTNSADYIVIRNNIFYNQYHANLNIQGECDYYLVENNYFIQGGLGKRFDAVQTGYFVQDDLRAGLYLNGNNIIFRHNLVAKHGSPRVTPSSSSYDFLTAIEMRSSVDALGTVTPVYYNRMYNNTVYNSYGVAFSMQLGGTDAGLGNYSNTIFNNAFVVTGDETWKTIYSNNADSAAIWLYDSHSTKDFVGNIIEYNYVSNLTNQILYGTSTQYDINDLNNSAFVTSNNIYGDTDVFDSPVDSISLTYWGANGSIDDFLDSLQTAFNPASELQNSGRHLATVTSNTTSSATLPVSDGKAFFSGFGWLEGDSIRITYGESISYNRISSISGNTLYLAESGSYTSGSYVDLVNSQLGSYSGSGVPIGMFDYQTTDTLAPSSLLPFVVYATSDSANFGLNFKTNYGTTDVVFQIATYNSEDELNDNSFIPIPSPVLGSGGTSTINHGVNGLSLGQTYYYRWKLTNTKGTTTGSVQTYTHEEPIAVSGETNSSVANDYDDLGYYSGGTSSTNYVGDVSGTDVNTALRFPSITVAQSSTIDSAFITVTASGNYSGTNCNIRVYGELRESPDSVLVFTPSGAVMAARSDSVTTAYVDTTMGAWTQDVEYRFNVTSIVQELINTHNYSSQPISFFLKDNTSTASANRRFYNYESGSKYPRVNIFYTE